MSPQEEKYWIEAAGGVYEAPKVRLVESYGVPIDADEQNWRRLSGDSLRDLPLVNQERMQRVAHWMWEQNPLANRLIELPLAFLLAEGVKLVVQDKDNQAVLDRFWRDPINSMDVKLPKKVRELAIFGEQCWPTFVNEIDGAVKLGYLDPALIGEIVKDPDNSEQPIGVVTKRDVKGNYRKFRIIINGPETEFTQRTQAIRATFTDGEAFFFTVNDLSAGNRGRSDLLHSIDWLDAYDQFLFGEADRYKLLRSIVWDLTLKNADPATVAKRAKEFVLPQSGGAYVHNDSEVLEPKSPDLGAQDTSSGARMLRNQILGGASLPEHWFAEGGNVNRATAGEMGTPTFKVMSMRQRMWKHILESMARYVLFMHAQSWGRHGLIDWSDPKWAPQAVMPDLAPADLAGNATALAQVAAACSTALDRGLLSEETSLKIIGVVAARLGVEVDAAAELEKAQTEAAARQAKDVFTVPPDTGDAGTGAQEGGSAK